MKYVSLFAGIGGFDLALNRLGHECVYVNEWDKYAAQTYEKNFGHRPDTTDITKVRADSIPDHDLLVGGFPCQAFSIAGKRRGFADTRGTLFFDIARILKEKQPSYIILENVKGLLSHDRGYTFGRIIASLDELGYDLQWQVLNSKNFGVPQNRERVFIVGHLRGEPRPKVFPLRAVNNVDDKLGKEAEGEGQRISATLDANYWKGWGQGRPFINAGGGRLPKIMAVRVQGDLDKRRTYLSNEMGTLAANPTSDNLARVTDGMKIRRLTPTECERLQGFPDGWTEGVSDTQRYKQLGNAVTVNVVEWIASQMHSYTT